MYPLLWAAHLCPFYPPTSLGKYFLNALVIRVPCSLLFWHFWLFIVFRLIVSFFWLCEEAKCFYLCLHLGRNPIKWILISPTEAGALAKAGAEWAGDRSFGERAERVAARILVLSHPPYNNRSFLWLLTFWPNNSLPWSCLMHWKMSSSSPGLYPLEANRRS